MGNCSKGPRIEDTGPPPPPSFEYRGVKVFAQYPHVEPKLDAISKAPKFTKWMDNFRLDEISMTEFHITDADFFGKGVADPVKLGFIKGYANAQDAKTGTRIPAIAFIRGDAVAVLIVVRIIETDKKHILMCRQQRFPVGRPLVETCAGMIDEMTRNVVGVVFHEVKEETGFVVKEEDLISLGKVIPSGGGCDEVVHLYAWETELLEEEFKEKQEKVFGIGDHEKIKLLFYEFEEFEDRLDEIMDMKAECCWRRYLRYTQKHSTRLSSTSADETKM